ncbi:MAG TPA: diguanylate cyclase [Thermoanaerobaculia bacterium]|nr:diguanylate cyclase [Thermoanaerobaculia bacterium]
MTRQYDRVDRRMRLRSRVILLTWVFALALFAITFGLSWQAKASQERWSHLIGVEARAIASLEELIRAQNAFRSRFESEAASGAIPPRAVERYRAVSQLLQNDALDTLPLGILRAKVKAFGASVTDAVVDWPAASPAARGQSLAEMAQISSDVNRAAQEVIDSRKQAIARQLPELERDTRSMMWSGLSIAWIVAICSFAVVRLTVARVVRPLEDLSAASGRIAAGDLGARAPVAGDREIARLAEAFNHMADALTASHAALAAHARTDELTGLPNFRAFRERLDEEIERAGRYPERFGVLVLDLDKFKAYNDELGHPAGNEALQRVSRAISDTLRAVDFPARYGGEEFVVIAPQIDLAGLVAMAERIRANVEALQPPAGGRGVTVSIGVAVFPEDGAAPQELIGRADERLYQAKREGRNRVIAPAAQRSA